MKNWSFFPLHQVIQLPRNSISLYGNQSTDDHDSLLYEWSLSPESKDKVVEMQVRLWILMFQLFFFLARKNNYAWPLNLSVPFRASGLRSCSCQPCRRETTPSSWRWQTRLDSRTPPRSPLLCNQVNTWGGNQSCLCNLCIFEPWEECRLNQLHS